MKAVLEKITPGSEQSFVVFSYRARRFQCPYHYHPEVELTWIVEGEGQRLIGNHLAAFKAGDLVLLGADLPHIYLSAHDFDRGPHGSISTVLQFQPDFAGGWLEKAPECRKIAELLRRAKRGLQIGAATTQTVLSPLQRLLEARGAARLLLILEVLAILAEANDLQPLATLGFHLAFDEKQGRKIEAVCAWVVEHFQETITLPQVARIAHMTPPAFSRFFRRATGRTLTRFINEVRTGHACKLLLETDRDVAEVAFASGYENLSNFNRRFLDLHGMTPKKFRAAALSAGSRKITRVISR